MLFWLSLGTLLLAFVLGAVAALAALAVVVYKVLCGLPGHHARVVQVRFGAPEEPAGRPSTAQGDGATDTQEAESARWFNDLVGALVSSMVGNGTFQTFVALRLERSVNKDRPTFVSPIRITSHNLDMVACPTVAAVRSQRDATGAHQLRGRFQLAWSGDLTVCVATELLVLGKALPLTGRIRLTSLRGDAAYTLGRGPDPLLVLGFERPPVLGCHVDTDIGSSLSIANLPRVGAYLASRVEALIGDELLLPGGGLVLHTPIPHVRSMRPMLKAKFDRKPKVVLKLFVCVITDVFIKRVLGRPPTRSKPGFRGCGCNKTPVPRESLPRPAQPRARPH